MYTGKTVLTIGSLVVYISNDGWTALAIAANKGSVVCFEGIIRIHVCVTVLDFGFSLQWI